MEDEYLRERKADLEQVVDRILRHMKGVPAPVAPRGQPRRKTQQDLLLDDTVDVPLVLVAHDLSGRHAAVQEKRVRRFCHRRGRQDIAHGDRGAQHGHSGRGGCARGQPAGAPGRLGHHRRRCRRDDRRPSAIILAEYGFRQRQIELERERLARLRHTPAVTSMAATSICWPISKCRETRPPPWPPVPWAWGCSGPNSCSWAALGNLPDEEEQYRAYREAVEGMQGLP